MFQNTKGQSKRNKENGDTKDRESNMASIPLSLLSKGRVTKKTKEEIAELADRHNQRWSFLEHKSIFVLLG